VRVEVGVHVAGELVVLELRVNDLELPRDKIRRQNVVLVFHERFGFHLNYGQDTHERLHFIHFLLLKEAKVHALRWGQLAEASQGVLPLVLVCHLVPFLNDISTKVWQLHQRVIALPAALNKALVEVQEGLECARRDHLSRLALLQHLDELHAHLQHALDVAGSDPADGR